MLAELFRLWLKRSTINEVDSACCRMSFRTAKGNAESSLDAIPEGAGVSAFSEKH